MPSSFEASATVKVHAVDSCPGFSSEGPPSPSAATDDRRKPSHLLLSVDITVSHYRRTKKLLAKPSHAET